MLRAWAISLPRTVIDVALALHLAGAVAYWWLSPKGFPADSSRFWLNSVIPWVLVAVAVVGLLAIHRTDWRVAACVVLGLGITWLVGAVAARVSFPESLRWLWLVPLGVSLCAVACFAWLASGSPRWYRAWIPTAIAFAFLGIFVVRAEVPPAPTTKPINAPAHQLAATDSNSISSRISDWCEFDANLGELSAKCGNLRVECSPLLDFHRISPDGFWSLLGRRPPHREPTIQVASDGVRGTGYSDGSILEIMGVEQPNALRLVSYCPFAHDTYAHLSTFCYISISGHKQLSLKFSPCPDREIEVLPADYPTGRPARVAYLNAAEQFRVVEASSGEKGPFKSLGEGKLAAGQPLTLTIFDERKPIASLTLYDWSQQASTDLSPTAGWGLPMNSIEFQRLGELPTAPIGIWVSLAATSVGRGWDCVGHRAGIYRNTIELRRLESKD